MDPQDHIGWTRAVGFPPVHSQVGYFLKHQLRALKLLNGFYQSQGAKLQATQFWGYTMCSRSLSPPGAMRFSFDSESGKSFDPAPTLISPCQVPLWCLCARHVKNSSASSEQPGCTANLPLAIMFSFSKGRLSKSYSSLNRFVLVV